MKYCRYQFDGRREYGLVESVTGHNTITRILAGPPHTRELRSESISPIQLEEATLLPPVEPSKIVCIGRNYREHAAELGNEVPKEPLIFLKPPSSLLNPGGNIVLPPISNRVDHEGELGIIIGKTCRNLKPDEDVRPYILGYTCVNDVTARDLQKKDVQFTRGKGFDTFCPIGPIVTDEIDPWVGIAVQTHVNGELRQDGNTRDFIFPIDVMIRFISQVMTLLPGDLIATGTPSGVGPLHNGDVVDITIPGIGSLENRVIEQS
jgi:2-keto-4-pentenoate hydratase/2-oxohepta-3-ene-1,7-dioic acid hydratase in catechol pathway